jgi:LysM repeat protein
MIDKSCFSHLYKVQASKLRTRYHLVKKGETLSKIAYKYGISVKTLARLNRISTKTKLRPGRRIKIR